MPSLKLIPPSTYNSYLLDVNTEIDVLKATVVRVINKPQCTLPKFETHTLYIDDQGRTTRIFWL